MKKIFSHLVFIFILLLVVIPANCFAMQINVNTLDEEGIIIEAESSDTIEAVKVKIYEGFKEKGNEEFLPELQKLTFNGKNLEEGRTLADYDIDKASEKIIIVTLIKTHFNITYKLSNLSSNNLDEIENGKDLEITLVADSNYKLPDSINIFMGGESFNKYTYDKATGKVFILSNDITDDIEIEAIGVEIEEVNPKTSDSIYFIMFICILSLSGYIVTSIYLNKKIRA